MVATTVIMRSHSRVLLALLILLFMSTASVVSLADSLKEGSGRSAAVRLRSSGRSVAAASTVFSGVDEILAFGVDGSISCLSSWGEHMWVTSLDRPMSSVWQSPEAFPGIVLTPHMSGRCVFEDLIRL